MKHKNLLKHRQILKIGLTEDNGLIIKFKDESHTYIDPEIMKEIMEAYYKLEDNETLIKIPFKEA